MMRMHYLASVAAAALLIPVAGHAQETTSTIRGSVTNNGNPVANATVTTVHVPSGTRSQVTTDAEGNFTVAGLRTGGPYTVEVTSSSGNQTVTDIYTVVQQAYALPIDLAATPDASSDIVVTASRIKGAGITSNGPSTVLDALQISKVASVNRDIRDIQRRDPFAAIDISNQGDRGGAVSFAGVNPRFNRFTINGVTVGDTFGLNQDASPNIRGPVPFDALAQVSVSVAPYDFRQSGFQGGAIDTVLKSGTNEFHGTGFYSQNTNKLSGTKIGSTVFARPKFKSETYGATLSGPILKDKLFFMVSGERNTDPRPYSTQVASYVNPSQVTAAINQISAIAKSSYNIEPGTALAINNRRDEKVVARLDWNVTTGQKFSFSYINSYNVQGSQNNTNINNVTYGLSTNAYALSELLRAGIVQLNSDWSGNFSTEARLYYRWSRRGQEPFGGRPNGQLGVCFDATSVGTISACSTGVPTIFFGPDNSRHTNQLFYDTWAGSFATRYETGNHEMRALVEVTRNRTFNNFVQNSLGTWYFDSLADFQARRANTVVYNAVLGGGDNAAADFNYTAYTIGAQDDWQVTDTLRVTFGARYTMYGMRDRPALNSFFTQRYGFSNQKTYKGLDQFEPRLSFEYKPNAKPFSFRGGVGIFGGGSPDIFLSNSFSNTITTNSLNIQRDANCNTPGSICDIALNNVTGKVPAALAAQAANISGSTSIPRTITGAIAPNFHLPRSLKATLSADFKLWGFNFGADYYYSNTMDAPIFIDARSVQVGTLPDGRPRYNGLLGFTDNNYDIILSTSNKGRSHIGVVRFDKKFDWGLSFGGSYTLQDVRDVGNASSATIQSNFRNQMFANPNFPALGTSSDQIKWAFKYNVGFDHAFFGDYRTVIQLFGETRAGRPYSFTMRDTPANRTGVFGTVLTGGNTNTNLLYVPRTGDDPIVTYAQGDTTTKAALEALINSTALKNYRGQIAPKNIARNRAFTQIDLHLEQEIPTFVGRSRVSLFADIMNLPNLLNKNWGGLRQLGLPYAASVVTVNCVNTAGVLIPSTAPIGAATPGGAPTPAAGGVPANTNPANGCAKYQYSSYQAPNNASVNFNGSFYAIRVGARFTF